MKKWLYSTAVVLLASVAAQAQDLEPAAVKQIVENRNFVFHAQQAIPQVGRARNVDFDYDLTVAGDSINAYLPYFGRAYTAPIDPNASGIKFATRKFSYKATNGKKSWKIDIEPERQGDVRQMFLEIFPNGRATLQVVLLNRSPISFQGYLTEGKESDKRGF